MTAIKVPPLGESIVEATISRWVKKEGEAVAAGETLVELETDKITVEVPALKAGVVTKLLKQEGDVVTVDETLGEMEEGAGAGASAGDGAATVPARGEPGTVRADGAVSGERRPTAGPDRDSATGTAVVWWSLGVAAAVLVLLAFVARYARRRAA